MTRFETLTRHAFGALVLAGVLACGWGGRNDGPAPAPPPPSVPAVPAVSPTPAANPVQLVPTSVVGSGDPIVESMKRYAQQFAQGLVPASALQRGTLPKGGVQDFQAILELGKCYAILGVGGPTVADLDLRLYDQNQVQIKQDTATDNYPVLGMPNDRICPQVSGLYRVRVEMYDGQGEFGVQVFGTP
jgi:hypothetical protein